MINLECKKLNLKTLYPYDTEKIYGESQGPFGVICIDAKLHLIDNGLSMIINSIV